MNSSNVTGMLDTMIIGGGQAGLALGHHLKEQHRTFLILDANPRTGDAWRQRWDSLRLFTPAKFDGLPGEPFPADPLSFPTKDEVAGYLESYAAGKGLPIVHGTRVERLWREADHFVAASNGRRWEARNAVVATGVSQAPKVPAFAAELAPSILQLHSSGYRNPGQLQDGPVLVVGLGNSGAEIALEVCRTHPTTVAGKPGGELPVKHGRAAARYALPLVRFLGLHVLTLGTPIGRKAAPVFKAHATPLIRTKTKDLAAAGVRLAPRVAGVEDGKPVLADGTRQDAANVIWCTGFRDDFSWIDPDLLDGGALPRQHRGIALDTPGLFFLGQEFLYAAASATLPGVGRDARYLAARIPAPLNRESAVAPT
ncbi:NAD(P)/FAD-dependent oxidoreductase [Pseudarthrobacter sp. GA104]|uniref:flavin-containing monooxygenase n=1 Tax=Pseudarthrobacter sp. GA104 TaxID=2676311 RepID=UPI0012FA1D95|nr:NAD(P)-binding domain-containing protein [Pseudarthrobacter sp. GA104]MUU72764.1 SidA/IucD/PvdA family monooxygenase [Pseudarthrobacter sp. GA104]